MGSTQFRLLYKSIRNLLLQTLSLVFILCYFAKYILNIWFARKQRGLNIFYD